jgi:capsular polysaccharide transport system permease protein
MDSALTVQGRVIFALMMHQVHTMYAESRLGYLWALFDVGWRIVVFWIMRTAMGFRPPHGMPLVLFLLFGFGVFQVFRSTITKCMHVKSGKMMVFPQIKKLDIFLAATIVLWATEIVAGAVIMFIGVGMGVEVHVSSWGGLFFTLLIIPVLGFGMGTLLESLSLLYPSLDRIVPLMLRLGMILSGVFYSVAGFPSSAMRYLWYNPILQIIEIGRSSMSLGYDAMDYSYTYILCVTGACLSLGLLMERYVRRKHR